MSTDIFYNRNPKPVTLYRVAENLYSVAEKVGIDTDIILDGDHIKMGRVQFTKDKFDSKCLRVYHDGELIYMGEQARVAVEIGMVMTLRDEGKEVPKLTYWNPGSDKFKQ